MTEPVSDWEYFLQIVREGWPALVIIGAIIVLSIIFSRIGKKARNVTRENSTPMEAELFCFVTRGSSSSSRTTIDRNIPNLDKYEHLIPKRSGRRFKSRNRSGNFPVVVATIDGKTRLVIAEQNPNNQLSEQDLGKKVIILYKWNLSFETFVISEDQSIATTGVSAMKSKEQYRKAAVAGSSFLIDMQSSVNTEKKKEMRNFIRKFRKESISGQDVSNYLTQSFFQSRMLQKRRLESVGVTIKEKYSTNLLRPFNDSSVLWLYDGKNVACHVSDEDGKRRKEYSISGSKKLTIREKNFTTYSVITNASGTSAKVKCPNCGHECEITSFFNGCEYCRTKFNVNDFDNRISSISLSEPGSTLSSGFMYILVYAMLPVNIWANVHFGIIGTEIPWSLIGGILLHMLYLVALIVLSLPFQLKHIINNARKHSIRKKMEKYDKYFSREHLFGEINFRLSLWAFSNKNDPLLQSVNNLCLDENDVIDMVVVYYHKMQLKEDGENLNIHCICNIRLVYLRNNRIEQDIGKYRLILARNKNVETDLSFDLQKIKCKACGASISLLDSSGVCQSCRTAVNLLNYDWIMTQITKIR